MRAIVAKLLRKASFGKGTHPGVTGYFICNKQISRGHKNLIGCCVADNLRRDYQGFKKAYRDGRFEL